LANVPTFQSNPYANFDISQWQNPYSLFQNQALPWPSSYAGWPTDASGNPIQPTPGMTLNSQPAPAAPAAAAAPAAPQFMPPQQPQTVAGPAGSGRGYTDYGNVITPPVASSAAQIAAALHPQQQSAAAAGAPAPSGGGGPLTIGSPLTAAQYMQLRANPGRIATPGATVPQSPTSAQPGPGVLQAFLQNWRPARSGPGSGFQQGFFNALNAGR
jgi:hypothetical protein